MKQPERFFENGEQYGNGAILFAVGPVSEREFRSLYIPVTKVVPEKFVNGLSTVVVTIGFKGFAGFHRGRSRDGDRSSGRVR